MKKLILILIAVCSAAIMKAQTIFENVPYIDANGEEKTCPSAILVENSDKQVEWTAGWYVSFRANCNIKSGVVCQGDVHLILEDDCSLTVTGDQSAGIQVSGEGNSLTIYGHKNQTGRLMATGGNYAGGIGGSDNGDGSDITINGGTITANGGYGGAGIGGGSVCSGSNITINGGIVTANGGDGGAGIGGGFMRYGSDITINGGIVTANGGDGGAGIGGGYMSSGSNITINGGMVTATGTSGAGIGSGSDPRHEESYDIFVAAELTVKADGNVITHTSSDDMAPDLADKKMVTAIDLTPFLKAIDVAVGNSENETILEIVNTAKTSILEQTTLDDVKSVSELAVAKIKALKEILPLIGDDTNVRNTEFLSDIIESITSATNKDVINTKKSQAKYEIPIFQNGFSSGKEVGKTDAFGTLGTPQNGPAIEVIDQNDNVLKLYNPKKVKFIKEGE